MGLDSYNAARMRDALGRVMWLLPHDARRSIYLRTHPDQRELFRTMREHDLGEVPGQGVSLTAFDRYRCIFVHIPKCAGMSVGRSLFGDYGGSHLGIPTYQMIFSKADFDAYFKFAFVRNPWDRVLSAYRFMDAVYNRYAEEYGTVPRPEEYADASDDLRTKLSTKFEVHGYDDFESFVAGWINPHNLRVHEHFRPQHRFVCSPDGALRLDYVARFETIESDVVKIGERLGIDATLGHDNRTDGDSVDYRDHYTPRMRKIVEEHYARDIELFDYTFDG